MKRGMFIGVVVILIIVISLSLNLVSASWLSNFWDKITGRTITGRLINMDVNNLTELIGDRSEIVYDVSADWCGGMGGGQFYSCFYCTYVHWPSGGRARFHWIFGTEARLDRCAGQSQTITLEDGSEVEIYSGIEVVDCDDVVYTFYGYQDVDVGEPWENGFCVPQNVRVNFNNEPGDAYYGSFERTAGRWVPVRSGDFTEIRNCRDLQNIQNNLEGNYILVSDIDCSETKNWKYEGDCTIDFTDMEKCNAQPNCGWVTQGHCTNETGSCSRFKSICESKECEGTWVDDSYCKSFTGFEPIGDYYNKFRGYIDGQEHVITGLYIDNPLQYYMGLFGKVEGWSSIQLIPTGGVIKNLGLVEPKINCSDIGYCGAFVGYLNVGEISNSYVLNGDVRGDSDVGGLVGWIYRDGIISNSYSTGIVSGRDRVGGLVGENDGTISNSYSTASVSGSGNKIGGLVGDNDGVCDNIFWDTETSGISSSACGTGKTTSEMKEKFTFTNAGWDFDNIWNIDDGNSYPWLRWQSDSYVMPVCGNNIKEIGEQCDGTDDIACAGACQNDCTCLVICNNNDICEQGENVKNCAQDCYYEEDTNRDGNVDANEIRNYVSKWKNEIGGITQIKATHAVDRWLLGISAHT